jgi:predicted ATP-binding protein involved in virulence
MQRVPQRMLVEKEGATLEVDQLSGGEKSLLAMAGDLARRLALANPSLGDPLSAEAVVLIDEIELHLHPGWQRMVVERLQQTFPHCQFILTTHSPQVLSQVPAESVILLERFQRMELPAGTLGRDSNSILSEVMGVPERPPAMAQRLHEVARMIDSGALPAAREVLEELARQLGQHDSEVVRLRALIGFLGG